MACVVAVSAGAWWSLGRGGTEAGTTPNRYLLAAADEHGAVVVDLDRRVYVGFDRDGRAVWEDGQAGRDRASVVCVAACPDVALSSPAGTVRWRLGTEVVDGGDVREVLWAASPEEAVVVTARPGGEPVVELRSPARPAAVTPVHGRFLSAQVARDGSRALLVEAGRDGSTTSVGRWFERTPGGWARAGGAFEFDGVGACIDEEGREALVRAGDAFRIRFGAAAPFVTGLGTDVGACAYTDDGVVLGEIAQVGQVIESSFRKLSIDGSVPSWTVELDGFGGLSTGGSLVGVATGDRLLVFGDVADPLVAMTAAAGALVGEETAVLVDDGGIPAWRAVGPP